MEKRKVVFVTFTAIAILLSMPSPVQAYDLRNLIDSITSAAKNIVQGLIFLCFIVGLGLYVIPLPWEEWSARGKALMTRACMAQVIYALATLIFQWLATFGGI